MKDEEGERGVRLQKILAAAGVASRRRAEELITAGRVTVNGRVVTELGTRIHPARDRVAVDGTPLPPGVRRHTYLVLHKLAGVVCTTSDPQGRRTVLDLVPARPGVRLWPVGRLDVDSEGLVLLTDDGELTNRLTHPRFEHEKEYHVLVAGQPAPAALGRLRRGIVLEGQRTAPAQIHILRPAGADTWLCVVLHEGRKHQVREMLEAVGHPVRRLIRVRIASLCLGDLASGQWRRLTAQEIQALLQ